MRTIRTRAELIELARELGVRPDWHEPDEQEITAVFGGTHMDFDNAFPAGHRYGYSLPEDKKRSELHVVLHRTHWNGNERRLGEPLAIVNLAMLFAWASGYRDEVERLRGGARDQLEQLEHERLEQLQKDQDDAIRGILLKHFRDVDMPDLRERIVEDLMNNLPRVRKSDVDNDRVTQRISVLHAWAGKFEKQRSNTPIGPQRMVVAALADAFSQAAKYEQAQHDATKRHPSEAVPPYGSHE